MCRLHCFPHLGPAVVPVVEVGSRNGGERSSGDHSRLGNHLPSICSMSAVNHVSPPLSSPSMSFLLLSFPSSISMH